MKDVEVRSGRIMNVWEDGRMRGEGEEGGMVQSEPGQGR